MTLLYDSLQKKIAIEPVYNTKSYCLKSLDRKSRQTLFKERRETMSFEKKLSPGAKWGRQKIIVEGGGKRHGKT